MTKIAPAVMIDGETVYPPGWMWILSFALAGCDWAIKEASTERFKESAKEYFREKRIYDIDLKIEELETKLRELRTMREQL